MQYDKRELGDLLKRVGIALLFFLLFFYVLIGVNSIRAVIAPDPAGARLLYIILDLVCSLCYALTFVVPVFIFRGISKNKPLPSMQLSLRFSENRPFLSSLAVVFIGISLCLACSYINSILFSPPEAVSGSEESFNQAYQWILLFISGAIVPAFAEELLFRGMVLSAIKPYSESGAILISALFFGIMHQTPYQFFYATAMGIVIGVVYVKTGSIWSCVLLHFTNNFFSVLQSFLLSVFSKELGEAIYYISVGCIIFFGILLGAILFGISCRPKKKDTDVIGAFDTKFAFDSDESHCSAAVVFRQAFATPAFIVFVIGCAANMILQALYV